MNTFIKQHWTPNKILCFLLPSLFFVTPLSSTGKSILMVATLIFVLLSADCRTSLKSLLTSRWFRALLLMVAIVLLGCLWSPASFSERGLILEKWSKLLTLPLLIVGFQQPQTRQWALKGFVLAMFLTCVLSLIMHWTHIFHFTGKITPEGIFRNHIMTSMMMSFAAYICLWLCVRTPNKQRFLYAVLSLTFSYHILFINQSRSGYVFFVLLMMAFIFQAFKRRQALVVLSGFVILCIGAIYTSPKIEQCVAQAIHNVQHYEQDKNTSVGFRMQFHQFARQLFMMHPYFGNGTGSFTYTFRVQDPVPAWKHDGGHSGTLLEPHSLYWLVAAEFGLLGLGVLAWFYAELFLLSLRLQTMRPFAIALLLIFAVGNTTDSLLFYSGSGYFFLLFFALCFSEVLVRQPKQTDAFIFNFKAQNALS